MKRRYCGSRNPVVKSTNVGGREAAWVPNRMRGCLPPRVNISAKTGRHMEKLVPALETALASWDTRIATGKFNALLAELTAEHPHPVRGGKQPRILFGTQAASRPPTFVLFTTGFLDPQYRRFITRRLREVCGRVSAGSSRQRQASDQLRASGRYSSAIAPMRPIFVPVMVVRCSRSSAP
jgi:hypothetical protein